MNQKNGIERFKTYNSNRLIHILAMSYTHVPVHYDDTHTARIFFWIERSLLLRTNRNKWHRKLEQMCISMCAFPIEYFSGKYTKTANSFFFVCLFYYYFYLWLVIMLSICGHIQFQFGYIFFSSYERWWWYIQREHTR